MPKAREKFQHQIKLRFNCIKKTGRSFPELAARYSIPTTTAKISISTAERYKSGLLKVLSFAARPRRSSRTPKVSSPTSSVRVEHKVCRLNNNWPAVSQLTCKTLLELDP